MQTLASSVYGVVGATNKFTWTINVLWRKRDGQHGHSQRESLDPCLDKL